MGMLLTAPVEAVNSFTMRGRLIPADDMGVQRVAIEVTMKSTALFLSNTFSFISGVTIGPSGGLPGGTELQDVRIVAKIKARAHSGNLLDIYIRKMPENADLLLRKRI
jgi:hypothetical protein